MLYDCLIIGCGPCGIAASIKLKQIGYKVAIIEKSTPGGKVNIAPRVDNYPGQSKIPGPELAFVLVERLNNNKVELIGDEVTSLTKDGNIFTLKCLNDTYQSKTVLIASGTLERKLGLKKEDELLGHGVSYCAICDGHFFINKDVLVIGGGNSALKEALYLANKVNHLYLIHRREEFRGYNYIVDELKAKENVTILTPYVPVEILGEGKVTGMIIKNVKTEKEETLILDGIFPLVGQIPSSSFIDIEGVKDQYNTIPVDKQMMTSCNGLFAGGDILPREVHQIYLSEVDGNRASKGIDEYLKQNEN